MIRDQFRRIRSEQADSVQGRRVDLSLTDPVTGASRWVDVSGVHPTVKSHLPGNLTFVKSLVRAEALASDKASPNLMSKTPSKAVSKAAGTKYTTYAQLTAIADMQVSAGMRNPGSFEFCAGIVSHTGECAPAVFNLIEWMARCYKRKLPTDPPRYDDLSPAFLTAAYRRSLKDGLSAAVVRGFGDMLLSAGLARPRGPRGNLRY